MSDPANPQPAPQPQPEPAAVEPVAVADVPAAEPSGSDGGAKVPTWLVVAIVAVVVVVVVVIVGLLVFGGDDEGDVAEVEGALPDQVTTEDADSPVVQMLTATQWDLDGSTLSSSFGNTCSYQGPESFLGCTLIGGDPERRVDLSGADLANTTSIGPTVPGLDVVGEAQEVSSSFQGCPSSIRLRGPDDPIGPGPAVCVQTDQERVFAVYLTHVAPEGALSFIAVEVTP